MSIIRHSLGRWFTGGALALAMFFALGAILRDGDLLPVLQQLKIPNNTWPFGDTRDILAYGADVREGRDVIHLSTAQPGTRIMPYPRVWILPGLIGFTLEQELLLCIALELGFLACVLSLAPRTSLAAAAVYTACLLSKPVAHLMVTANFDIVIFILLYFAGLLCLFEKRGKWTANGVVLFAAVLKFYPAAAFPALIRERSKCALLTSSLFLLVFGAYLLSPFSDVDKVSRILPQVRWSSFGGKLIFVVLEDTARLRGWPIPSPQLGSLLLAAIAGALASLIAMRPHPVNHASATDVRELHFRIGALIYLGSFVLTIAFTYRMVFLLLCLPWLLEAARKDRLALTATALIVTVFWSCNHWFWWSIYLDCALHWMLFTAVGALIIKQMIDLFSLTPHRIESHAGTAQ
jgi:hypothetical protein